MKRLFSHALTALALPLFAAGSDGFVSRFNGLDLADWTNTNCAPGVACCLIDPPAA